MGWNPEQLLGFELTDWLLDAGAAVHKKRLTLSNPDDLSPAEHLLYEFWLFDMEQQNGGVSQYFLNRPISHWDSLSVLGRSFVPTFIPFAARIDSIVIGVPDAHEAFHDIDVDHLYQVIRVRVLQELKAFVQDHP